MSLAAPLPFGIVGSQFAGQRVHFVGIGGSGMSGLARILIDSGAIVTGTEPKPSHVTFQLMQLGAKINHAQDGELITPKTSLVVRTAAIKDDNPEWVKATSLGLPTMKYAQLLGQIMGERKGVAIAGTHGKSTTTAMTALILTTLGLEPSWVVGGTVPQLGGGSKSGSGEVFVAEACEYDRSFHNLKPTVAVVTNVDADHLDVYGNLDAIVDSFKTFAKLLPQRGRIITLAGSEPVAKAFDFLPIAMDVIGFKGTHDTGLTGAKNRRIWEIDEIDSPGSFPRAIVSIAGEGTYELRLSVPGRHNLLNATMAVAAARAVGAPLKEAFQAVSEFTGVDRRMQVLGSYNGATVVDDYGHHPTEIRATLNALKNKYQPKNLYCVFQPHQASRTRMLFSEFASAFHDADEVLMPEIYYVRDSDEDKAAVSSAKLAAAIRARGVSAAFLSTYASCVEALRTKIGPGDLVVTMGAGPVCDVAKELVAAQK